MSIAAVSASSRSAGSWACRRPPTTSAPAASAARAPSRTTGWWGAFASCTRPTTDAYGYRRMWKALRRAGEQVPRCRGQRLMCEHGIVGAKRRGRPWRTTRPDPDAHRRPDLVQRHFSVEAPDRLWVADLSYLRSWEGVVFFAFVIDAYSRRVVGWQLAPHMRTTLVLDALRMALGQRHGGADVALVHHSDRGSQPGLNRSSQQCVFVR